MSLQGWTVYRFAGDDPYGELVQEEVGRDADLRFVDTSQGEFSLRVYDPSRVDDDGCTLVVMQRRMYLGRLAYHDSDRTSVEGFVNVANDVRRHDESRPWTRPAPSWHLERWLLYTPPEKK